MIRSGTDLMGQSLMLSFDGARATPELLEALERTRPCGVILFAHNIVSPAQLYELNRTLQAHAEAIDLPPLLIAIDQEGGTVARLPAPFTTVPSQMAQAATADANSAYECAYMTGQQLRAFGINVNFAPVLDVNNNPLNPVISFRSFGHDPEAVTRWGLEALRGYRETNVIATVKHFPGHGDTDMDSHLGLPVVRHDRARLDTIEFVPFAAAIKAGAPALMTAHIVFEAIDAIPATFSKRILTDLLRHELGFDGVVFTDALNMRAIADRYGIGEAAISAKSAGADVMLPCGPLTPQIEAAEQLVRALEEGRLASDPFTATARRLDRLRKDYAIGYDLPAYGDPDDELHAQALEIARRSITVLEAGNVLPLLPSTRLLLIDCMLPRFSQAEEALERAELLRGLMQSAFPNMVALTLGSTPETDQVRQALELAERCEATVFVTRNASLIPAQGQLAKAFADVSTPLIHVAARSPYDAGVVPSAAVTLLTYGDPVVSLEALVDVLAGRTTAQGTLPVELMNASIYR